MTVAELIEELSRLPRYIPVRVGHCEVFGAQLGNDYGQCVQLDVDLDDSDLEVDDG